MTGVPPPSNPANQTGGPVCINVPDIRLLFSAAPATYKTVKAKPLLTKQKTGYSTASGGSVYMGVTKGATTAKVLSLVKSFTNCITVFQTDKILFPPGFKP